MGKYLHEFQNDSAFQSFISSDSYVEPFVSSTNMGNDEWRIDYNQDNGGGGGGDEYLTMPLTFEITSDGNINWVAKNPGFTVTIEYSKNGGEWTEITSVDGSSAPTISVVSGDTVQFRGDNATYSSGTSRNNTFSASTCGFIVKGNIMSLINSTGFATATTFEGEYVFNSLFIGCAGLTDASNLKLPVMIMTYGSYYNMFFGCTGLVAAPELPSDSLAGYCYGQMFKSCSSLTTAPELPAEKLEQSCYTQMFGGCTNLNYIKCLATDITTGTAKWVQNVASSGTFVKAAEMDNWQWGDSGIPNGWTVEDA